MAKHLGRSPNSILYQLIEKADLKELELKKLDVEKTDNVKIINHGKAWTSREKEELKILVKSKSLFGSI